MAASRMIPPRLVCLGQFTIDDIVRWDGTVRMGCVGGDVVYSWFGAHLWIDDVGLVAPVGNDFPASELETLARAGASLEGIAVRDVPTMRSWALYEQDGRRTWVMRSDPSHFYELSPRPADIPRPCLGAPAFHIAAMDMAAQIELATGLRRDGVLVALDPQEDYIVGNEKRLLTLVEQVNVFLPSAVEVRRLVGHSDYEAAAKALAALGPSVVVIKLGPEGALVYDRATGLSQHVPAYSVRVVDDTGAGDAFCGGFMAGLASGLAAQEAAARGVVSASFVIEAFGWLPLLLLTRADAEDRLQRYLGSS
jgi:ribokinase